MQPCPARPKAARRLDLRRLPLLHDDSPDGWRRWLAAARITGVDVDRGHTFTDANLTLQAAADGLGVAVGRRVLVEPELRSGRLVRPFAISVPADPSYYLVSAEHTADLPKVQDFHAWLRDEIGRQTADRDCQP